MIDTVKAINENLDHLRAESGLDPIRTSTPIQPPRSSQTEEKRLLLQSNVEHIEHLSRQIRDLHFSEDDLSGEDLLLMDYVTDIVRTMPSLLEGT